MTNPSPTQLGLPFKQGGKIKANAGGGKPAPTDLRKEAGLERDVVNCLSCGKVYDCRQLAQPDVIKFLERKGLCTFCGSQVSLTHRSTGSLSSTIPSDVMGKPDNVTQSTTAETQSTDADETAIAFKNRLVLYDKESAKRTTVIDDQSDFFEVESNLWSTDAERTHMRERRLLEEQAEAARRQRVAVTIDLMGRRVLVADPASSLKGAAFVTSDAEVVPAYDPRAQANEALWADGKSPVTTTEAPGLNSATSTCKAVDDLHNLKIQPNPNLPTTAPRFIRHSTSTPRVTPAHANNSRGHAHGHVHGHAHGHKENSVPRVQDDLMDVFSEFKAQVSETDVQDSTFLDICPSEFVGLEPLQPRSSVPAQLPNEVTDLSALPKGFILLRGWLTLAVQQELVHAIRQLGLGPGGFYTPSYGSGRDMHLQMMCLGSHWEPRTHSYSPVRSHDGAVPPPIPERFRVLCAGALADATRESMRRHTVGFPALAPDVCLVNFYDGHGRLRLHQDKDESSASLGWRAPPVVSFSLGDSCDFMFGDSADEAAAQSVRLESGDVLVFGGSSRLKFHGVRSILPSTAPPQLTKTTGLRPGRINLTFRQM